MCYTVGMYRFVLLCSILAIGAAKAEDVPFDVVTYDTVKRFCEEKDNEFKNWIKVYQYQVKSGAGKIYPKEGTIYDPENPQQKNAHMIAFYCKERSEKGYFLVNAGETYLIFQKGPVSGIGR